MDFCPEADTTLMTILAQYMTTSIGKLTFTSVPYGASPLFHDVQSNPQWKHTTLTLFNIIAFDPIDAYDRAMKGL